MIVCPVCEHQQVAGYECDVCGKDLGASLGGSDLIAPPAPEVPRLPELELPPNAAVGEVAVQRMPELELNATLGLANVPTPAMPDLDTARAPAVAVPVERLADLAQDRAEFVGQKAQAPGASLQCRYCGTVQAQGAICDRCGMRLPRAAAGLAEDKLPAELVRCKFCGSPGHAGHRCKECGRVLPAKET